MLNLTQKIIENLSNRVSTLSFVGGSNLSIPVENKDFQNKNSYFSKSMNYTDNSFYDEQDGSQESNVQQNLAKSRRSKQSIELKRDIIRKMNEKIILLQKKAKIQKVDVFQLQACKNDLLLDFLQYENSKRKHQQQLNQIQDENNGQKSFFFMKSQMGQQKQQQNQETKKLNKKFNKKNYALTRSILQEKKQIVQKQKLVPIQIIIPLIKLVQVQIPLLKFGSTKTPSTDVRISKQSQQYFSILANQINTADDFEQQRMYKQLHNHMNSSRSELFYQQGRVIDLNSSDRSQRSVDCRVNIKSDRFFINEEQIKKNQNELKKNFDDVVRNERDRKVNTSFQSILDESFNKQQIKKQDNSLNVSIFEDQLQLNSHVDLGKSRVHQQMYFQNQNQQIQTDRPKEWQIQIQELRITIKDKQSLIISLTNQNNIFQTQIIRLKSLSTKSIESSKSKQTQIQRLSQVIIKLQTQIKQIQHQSTKNSTKLMNQIYQLSNQLQSKNEQLGYALDSLQVIEQNSYKKQKQLLYQIQTIECLNQKLKQQIDFYKSHLKQEGFKLNFNQIELIEQAIQDRQQMYQKDIQKIKHIYQSEIEELKQKCSVLQIEFSNNISNHQILNLNNQKIINLNNQKIINLNNQKILNLNNQINSNGRHLSLKNSQKESPHHQSSKWKQQVQAIIEMYDQQLQIRDNQIIQLKKHINNSQLAFLQLLQKKVLIENDLKIVSTKISTKRDAQHLSTKQQNVGRDSKKEIKYYEQNNSIQIESIEKNNLIMMEILSIKNQSLELRLLNEQKYQKNLKQKLTQLEELVLQADDSKNNQNSKNNIIDYNNSQFQLQLSNDNYQLIQRLMEQVEKQKKTNKKLKKRLNEEKPLSPSSQIRQITNLKQKNQKLLKYSKILEKQIKQIYQVNDCLAHSKIINRIEKQLQGFRNSIETQCTSNSSKILKFN